jgi:hypothetical protein
MVGTGLAWLRPGALQGAPSSLAKTGKPGHDGPQDSAYRFAFRFFAVFRFFPPLFFGTFAPAARASESPMAIACLRLLTLRPERPLFNVPDLRFFIARPTFALAFLEYFRAMKMFS